MANSPNPTNPYAPQHQQHAGSSGGHAGGTGVIDTIRQTASHVGDAASAVVHKVEDAWDSTSQGVQQGAHYVAEKASDFWTDCTDMVRRYPVASVMIAFGMGCLVASLFTVPNWTDDVARRMSRASS
jgi:ElaB/YqjD/DUF883 family membrane-anchored ribosome-binding protein